MKNNELGYAWRYHSHCGSKANSLRMERLDGLGQALRKSLALGKLLPSQSSLVRYPLPRTRILLWPSEGFVQLTQLAQPPTEVWLPARRNCVARPHRSRQISLGCSSVFLASGLLCLRENLALMHISCNKLRVTSFYRRVSKTLKHKHLDCNLSR